MQQSITDFLSGLSKGFGNYIKEVMEKFRKKLFFASVTILLTGIGFFLTLWGIASTIDVMFTMRGLGYVLIGLISVLTGACI